MLIVDSYTLNGWTLDPAPVHSCAAGKHPIAFRYEPIAAVTVVPGGSLPSILVNFHVSGLGDPGGAAPPQTVGNEASLTHTHVSHGALADTQNVTIPVSTSLRSRKSVAGAYDAPLTGPVSGVYAGAWSQTVRIRARRSTTPPTPIPADRSPTSWPSSTAETVT